MIKTVYEQGVKFSLTDSFDRSKNGRMKTPISDHLMIKLYWWWLISKGG